MMMSIGIYINFKTNVKSICNVNTWINKVQENIKETKALLYAHSHNHPQTLAHNIRRQINAPTEFDPLWCMFPTHVCSIECRTPTEHCNISHTRKFCFQVAATEFRVFLSVSIQLYDSFSNVTSIKSLSFILVFATI